MSNPIRVHPRHAQQPFSVTSPAADSVSAGGSDAGRAEMLEHAKQVQYLQLLALGGNLVTEVLSPQSGTLLATAAGGYVALYKNTTNSPVRIQVFADIITPGAGIKLSFTADASHTGKFDELVLTANGHTESVSIILLANSTLFACDFDNATFPMAAQDVIRFRVFDPARLLTNAAMYPRLP